MPSRDNHKIKVRIPWLFEADATGWLGIAALVVIFLVAMVILRVV
jgi:hypothetical protein